jgi:hypothetical protein
MDMVKRVADAINAELLKPWDETIGGPKQSERLALAAMRAMDEPTEEMLPDVPAFDGQGRIDGGRQGEGDA